MDRFFKFSSIFGENWVVGRYLLPQMTTLGADQHGVLLDLACGESPFRRYFPCVDKYLRIDRNPVDSEVIKGDMHSIPQESNSVDIVLLFQAITDVSNPVEVLIEARRVLKPKGRLLLFESMAYPEHDVPFDYYRLMPEGLSTIAEEAGFTVFRCIRLGGLFTRFAGLWNTFVMGQLMRYALLKPFAYLGIAGCNLLCYGLDRLLPHPRLASDYLAILSLDRSDADTTDFFNK